jgi:hypothetical protein
VIGFAVSLCDVAPDGTSHLVAKGMLNATRRETFRAFAPLTPGEIYELDIQIDCTAWVFAKGHRIRLVIASADWPNVWPTPYPATNQVHWGPQRPSRLILPTVPARGSAPPPAFKPSTQSVSSPAEASGRPEWRVSRNHLTGRTQVDLRFAASWPVGNTTRIEREHTSRFDVNPDQPSDATGWAHHIFRLVRPNHVTETCADVAVQATTTHFHMTIDLVVRINRALHFTKHWSESVPRLGL